MVDLDVRYVDYDGNERTEKHRFDLYIGSAAERGMKLLKAHEMDILPSLSKLEGLSREGWWVVYVLVGASVFNTLYDIDCIYGSASPFHDRTTYRELFDDFTDVQKIAVYEIVGRLIEYYKGGPYE